VPVWDVQGLRVELGLHTQIRTGAARPVREREIEREIERERELVYILTVYQCPCRYSQLI